MLEVTDVSLYQAWIEPEVVRAMSDALSALPPDELVRIWDRVGTRTGVSHSVAEVEELTMFFRICAGRGLGLIGWW